MNWLIQDMVPTGAIVTIMDEGDGPAQAALNAGFDAVLYLHSADPETLNGKPFLFEVLWRDGLVPGRRSPAAFWVRWTGSGFERVEEWAA
jgi:hypothetical protein